MSEYARPGEERSDCVMGVHSEGHLMAIVADMNKALTSSGKTLDAFGSNPQSIMP